MQSRSAFPMFPRMWYELLYKAFTFCLLAACKLPYLYESRVSSSSSRAHDSSVCGSRVQAILEQKCPTGGFPLRGHNGNEVTRSRVSCHSSLYFISTCGGKGNRKYFRRSSLPVANADGKALLVHQGSRRELHV